MTHEITTTPHHPDPEGPAEKLWGRAEGCFQAFEMMFGQGPGAARALMDAHFLKLTEARAARAFLRGLEALVRRLLLVRALVLLPDLAPTRRDRRRRTRPASDIFDLPENPEHWPTRFAYRLSRLLVPATDETPDAPRLPPAPRAKPCHVGCAIKAQLGRRNPCPPHCPKLKTAIDPTRAFVRSAPTALRLEALRRVIDNPEPFASRMAHSIRRHNARTNAARKLGPAPHLHKDHQRFLMVAIDQSARLARSALAPPPSPPDTS